MRPSASGCLLAAQVLQLPMAQVHTDLGRRRNKDLFEKEQAAQAQLGGQPARRHEMDWNVQPKQAKNLNPRPTASRARAAPDGAPMKSPADSRANDELDW